MSALDELSKIPVEDMTALQYAVFRMASLNDGEAIQAADQLATLTARLEEAERLLIQTCESYEEFLDYAAEYIPELQNGEKSYVGEDVVLLEAIDFIATSTANRLKSTRARWQTARPHSLIFASEPGQATSRIRANYALIPGPVVSVRDALGNTFPGEMDVTMTIEPGTGRTGAALFGTPFVTYANGEARFGNLGVDSAGSGSD